MISVNHLTAFVLAGGKSTRMGTDKAFLELAGQTLLAHAMQLAGAVAGDVRIVGDAKKFSAYGPVVEDIFRDRGPLAGIHAALRTSTTDLNLVLAVDLPFVETKFLEYLVAQARATSATIIVPRAGGGWQPLCAVYRRAFADLAERSLREGRNKIDPLFSLLETRVIEEDELSRLGLSAEIFRNLNTPEEWERARINQGEQGGTQS